MQRLYHLIDSAATRYLPGAELPAMESPSYRRRCFSGHLELESFAPCAAQSELPSRPRTYVRRLTVS